MCVLTSGKRVFEGVRERFFFFCLSKKLGRQLLKSGFLPLTEIRIISGKQQVGKH